MLDIGMSELVVIGVVALVVVGPKELPKLLRSTGQWVAKARRMASDFQGQLNEAIREADLDDVKKSVEDLRSLSPSRLIADQLEAATGDLHRIGGETREELAKIEASFDAVQPADTAVVEPETASLSADEAERLIDAAAAPVADLAAPIYEVSSTTAAPDFAPIDDQLSVPVAAVEPVATHETGDAPASKKDARDA